MKSNRELFINDRRVPSLEEAINHWLAARARFKIEPSNESQHEYVATLFHLGVAWRKHYSEDADTPGAFEWYRRGLIAPEEDQ